MNFMMLPQHHHQMIKRYCSYSIATSSSTIFSPLMVTNKPQGIISNSKVSLTHPLFIQHQKSSFFSTSTTQYPHRSRIGIGGTSLSPNQPGSASGSSSSSGNFSQKSMAQYASVISTALKYNVTTFESGYHGEEQLAQAFSIAVQNRAEETPTQKEEEVTLTARFGYRNLLEEKESTLGNLNGDVPVESTPSSDGGEGTEVIVAHNLSREYTQKILSSSPLVQLCHNIQKEKQKPDSNLPSVHLLFMAHNPETQGAPPSSIASTATPPDLTSIRTNIKSSLRETFVELEKAVLGGDISSYGVCSNGLALPENHPLHLSWRDVLEASVEAVKEVYPNDEDKKVAFSTFQLPANLCELNGIKVANDIQTFLSSEKSEEEELKKYLPPNLNIYMTRPLTYHPDLGLGLITHPYKFVDYQLPTKPPSEMSTDTNNYQWTNETLEDSNSSSQSLYQSSYNVAMNHFDATHLLEKQQSSSSVELSTEERETLEGCRLLQSMIHDLDVKLPTYKTIGEYEGEVFNTIMPLLSDSFEELDEESGSVLQSFFAAHGSAVRQTVAHNTRELLKKGGGAKMDSPQQKNFNNMISSSSIISPPSYDIPNNVTLQEYALQFLLQKDKNAVTKVIVGCPDANHVLEAVRAADRLVLEEEKKEDKE